MKTEELAKLVLTELSNRGKVDNYNIYHPIEEIINNINPEQSNQFRAIGDWLKDNNFAKITGSRPLAIITTEGNIYLEQNEEKNILQPTVINHFNGSNVNFAIGSNNVQKIINSSSELDKIITDIIKTLMDDKYISAEQKKDVITDIEILKSELNRPTKRWDRIKDNVSFLANTTSIAGYIPTLLELINNLQK